MISPRGEVRNPSAGSGLSSCVPKPTVLVANHRSDQPGAGGGGVVDVVLAPVLLVHRPVVVAVDHAVDPEHVRLVLLHHALRLQYKSRPALQEDSDGCGSIFKV